jgi:cytochrome c5
VRFLTCFIVTAVVMTVGALTASAGQLGGKELYRANCHSCHDKGSPNGYYAAMTLTQAQWRTFFKVKLIPSHKNAIEPKSGKKLLEFITPDQMKAIQRFCIDHAADSEQPATCG